jgi:hypothetical protein
MNRRRFLAGSAAAVAAPILPAVGDDGVLAFQTADMFWVDLGETLERLAELTRRYTLVVPTPCEFVARAIAAERSNVDVVVLP